MCLCEDNFTRETVHDQLQLLFASQNVACLIKLPLNLTPTSLWVKGFFLMEVEVVKEDVEDVKNVFTLKSQRK